VFVNWCLEQGHCILFRPATFPFDWKFFYINIVALKKVMWNPIAAAFAFDPAVADGTYPAN
jgi:hypothetical protein